MLNLDRLGTKGDMGKTLLGSGALIFALGFVLEFYWAAPLLVLAFAWFWIWPKQIHAWLGLGIAFTLLGWINGNWWALPAMPLILSVRRDTTPMPRYLRPFWMYYPAHLAILAVMGLSVTR